MRDEKQSKEGDHADQRKPGVKCDHHTGSRRNSLTALKVHVERIIVSQNGSSARIEAKELDDLFMALTEYSPYQQRRKYALQAVPQEYDQSCLAPKDAKRIGRARIAAPVLPDVNSLQLSIKESRLKQSKNISDQNCSNTC